MITFAEDYLETEECIIAQLEVSQASRDKEDLLLRRKNRGHKNAYSICEGASYNQKFWKCINK